MYKLLIINPGSTSTKIGIYEDEKQLLEKTIVHTLKELDEFNSIYDQREFRKEKILKLLKEKGIDLGTINAVVGRGGLLRPIEGGTYKVNDNMLRDLKIGYQGNHASNLGGILAEEIARALNISAYIVDPVVVDELDEVARITGLPEFKRKSIFHALNQKAVAKKYAKDNHKKYEDVRVIVAHMGGGTSVGAHRDGRIVDVNNALDGEGAFSPERCGTLPAGDLVRLCFSGKYTYEQIKKMLTGKGGVAAYFDTNDFRDVVSKVENGDKEAKLIYDAYIYQVAKEIGQYATVLNGKVDAIILTGGIAYNEVIVSKIREKVGFIAPIVVYPGEDEMLAMSEGALRVLRGEEEVKVY